MAGQCRSVGLRSSRQWSCQVLQFGESLTGTEEARNMQRLAEGALADLTQNFRLRQESELDFLRLIQRLRTGKRQISSQEDVHAIVLASGVGEQMANFLPRT